MDNLSAQLLQCFHERVADSVGPVPAVASTKHGPAVARPPQRAIENPKFFAHKTWAVDVIKLHAALALLELQISEISDVFLKSPADRRIEAEGSARKTCLKNDIKSWIWLAPFFLPSDLSALKPEFEEFGIGHRNCWHYL